MTKSNLSFSLASDLPSRFLLPLSRSAQPVRGAQQPTRFSAPSRSGDTSARLPTPCLASEAFSVMIPAQLSSLQMNKRMTRLSRNPHTAVTRGESHPAFSHLLPSAYPVHPTAMRFRDLSLATLPAPSKGCLRSSSVKTPIPALRHKLGPWGKVPFTEPCLSKCLLLPWPV